MNRERAKELLPIIEAFANGEEIEEQYEDSEWRELDGWLVADANAYKYRIKPKPREFVIYPSTTARVGWAIMTETDDIDNYFDAIKVREVL